MVLENPKGSRLFQFPPIQAALEAINARAVHTHLGSFGMAIPKPITLWGTASFLPSLRRDLPRLTGQHLSFMYMQHDSACYQVLFTIHFQIPKFFVKSNLKSQLWHWKCPRKSRPLLCNNMGRWGKGKDHWTFSTAANSKVSNGI